MFFSICHCSLWLICIPPDNTAHCVWVFAATSQRNMLLLQNVHSNHKNIYWQNNWLYKSEKVEWVRMWWSGAACWGSSFSTSPSQAGRAGGTGLERSGKWWSCQPFSAALMCPRPTDREPAHHWSHGTGTTQGGGVLLWSAPPLPSVTRYRTHWCIKQLHTGK